MNEALFLSLGYVMSLAVGAYVLVQFFVDRESRVSASKRALMIIVLAWIVSGLFFFVYDVMYPPRPVPLFAAYTLLFVLLATPFYAFFLAYACKQRDVYSAGLRPHSELIEQQQAPAMSADRFVLYKQKLKQLMEEESLWKDPGLSAEKLAMQVGTNRSYLSQIVSEVYGRPFRTVVNNYRVDCVKGLLIDEPDLRLNEIAQNAGFASASSLNHVFKQWTGFNPSDYKAAVGNANKQKQNIDKRFKYYIYSFNHSVNPECLSIFEAKTKMTLNLRWYEKESLDSG